MNLTTIQHRSPFSSAGSRLRTTDGNWELRETIGQSLPWQLFRIRADRFTKREVSYPVGSGHRDLATARKYLDLQTKRTAASLRDQWFAPLGSTTATAAVR